MVRHPICHFFLQNHSSSVIHLILFLKILSHAGLSSFVFLSKVRGCRCCFSLATLGEAVPLCKWLTGGGCGCVYCFKCLSFSPPPQRKQRGKKLPSWHWSEVSVLFCWLESVLFGGMLWQISVGGKLFSVSGLRWRRSWGVAVRGAWRRGSDSDGLLMTPRPLTPSDGRADDSEQPGSSGCPAASSVWMWWRPQSERCPSLLCCTLHTGSRILHCPMTRAWALV